MQKVLLLTFLFVNSICSFCQNVGKTLKTEADGFKWYHIKTETGKVSAESVDGCVIVPPLDSKDYYIYYSKTGYGDHKNDKRPSFFTANKYKGEGKSFEIIGSAIYSPSGENIIPFSRGYKSILYIWQKDNVRTYFQVTKVLDGKIKEGVCDIQGNEIVEPKYEGVVYMVDGFHANTGGLNYINLNIMLNKNSLVTTDNILDKSLCTEDDGFKWYKTYKKGVFGAEDVFGKTLIPLSRGYSSIFYNDNYGGYFMCELNGTYFECDLTGKVLSKEEYLALQKSFQKGNEGTADKSAMLKGLFEQANKTSNSEAQKKFNLYMQVVNADPNGTLGYKAAALNNIGVMYYNMEDYKNAKLYFEKSLEVAPSYADAQANLKLAKSARRSQRWDNVIGVLGAIGEAASTISGSSQTGGTYNAYQGSGGVYSGSSTAVGNNTMASTQGNSVTVSDDGNTTRIELSGGGYMQNTKNADGSVNSQAYQPCIICHGSKTCAVCFGQGGVYNRAYNYWTTCSSCGGRKTCNFCNGTGYSTFVSHTDANGNGYGASNSGYTTTRNAGGVTVTNSDGKTTVYSNGGDTTSERSSQSSSSKGTCSKCNGRKYESTSYSALPASAHGWAQPYHHSGGTGCPYCTSVVDHYHAPCNSCRGFGHN